MKMILSTMASVMLMTSTVNAEDAKELKVNVVAPNVISTQYMEFGATLDPLGDRMYYTVSDGIYAHMTILVSEKKNGKWQKPEIASFSGEWSDADPSFSPDGKRIYYVSNRPVKGNKPGHQELWFVDRQADGSWGEPNTIDAITAKKEHKAYPSAASDGSIYYGARDGVFVSKLVGGEYQKPELIGIKTTTLSVSPDQSYMIIARKGPEGKGAELAITYNNDGKWGPLVDLPEPINSRFDESSPNISADGKVLTFTSTRVDYDGIEWPRKNRISSMEALEKELGNSWKNKLRNIYQVKINHGAFMSKDK